MKLSYVKLTEQELHAALETLPSWTVSDGRLQREFTFSNYKEGVVFASAVGWEADRLNHHPDMTVSYGKVTVSTVTHDSDGLTPYDVELARLVDSLV
ncbi:MAG: 4a-hydroxytetrahydrobiopterin dehydratase [Armatimonadetes bacterium]|mgnify:CR=1 FL=1|nr:4a-hydroxytetrahydrobiopterin dehydratase [Armatimonadota bacterium]